LTSEANNSGNGTSLGGAAAGEVSGAGPRERILQAALKLFVEQGYFNTNVPDISKLSRCSVGSIYHHFLNKEEIAGQLYRDSLSRFREALFIAIHGDESLVDTVKSVVVAFLSFAEDNKLLAQYLWLARHSEFLNNKIVKPTTVGFDSLGRILTKRIKAGIRSGEIPPIRAEILWTIVFGIPLSFVTDWLEGHTRRSPKQVANELSQACWAALQSK